MTGDRRVASRIKAALKVVLSVPGRYSPESQIAAVSVDISTYGIGLQLSEPLSEPGEVGIRIYDPSKDSTIEARGTVMWQDKGPGSLFRAGMEFTEVAWSRIHDLMRSISR